MAFLPLCRQTLPPMISACSFRRLALTLAVLAAAPSLGLAAEPYQDKSRSVDERVADLMPRLTADEKLSLLTGTGFTTHPIPRLGIPAMTMVDAGQGVRGGPKGNMGPATAFPCGAAMASTWDTDLIRRIGAAIGVEARNKGDGAQVLLGPAVNIHRSPLGGRNGEYFSEDPYLAGRLAVPYIQGMQSTGVAACIKHYACNNQETQRMSVDARVSERALREIYLPAFEAGVTEGGVWTLMSSYNQINGHHASANEYLLKDVLKTGWKFDGLVMSDWGGVHETDVAKYGNDLEMPGGKWATPEKLKAALADGSLSPADVDESARRVLKTVIRVGLLDNPPKPDHSLVNSKEHADLAREGATEGIILLKNAGNLLPLDRAKTRKIAVIGKPATDLVVGALGSPYVRPAHTTEIFDGIKSLVGENVQVVHDDAVIGSRIPSGIAFLPGTTTPGFKAEYFKGTKLEGDPVLTRTDADISFTTEDGQHWEGAPAGQFSVRWTADLKVPASGKYTFSLRGDDGFRMKIDGQQLFARWKNGGASNKFHTVELTAGDIHKVEVEYFQDRGDAIAQLQWITPQDAAFPGAASAAKDADAVVLCLSTMRGEGEGNDRESMDLPNYQDELVKSVLAVNKNVVIVLNNGTPVTMKQWAVQTPAILETWFPGQEGGAALASILFGDANPSGKLATTLAVSREDYPDAANFPGDEKTVKYEEGIYVGYRHFDKKRIEPLFPFGHGLSYTTFSYANAKVSGDLSPEGTVTVTADITNSGARPGSEVVQLYVHPEAGSVDRPVRELKGFARVTLKPGETKPVTFTLKPRDLAYFDVAGKEWKADAGEYTLEIAASSRDIRQTTRLKLAGTFTQAVPESKDLVGN